MISGSQSRSVFTLVWILILTAVIAVSIVIGMGYRIVSDLNAQKDEIRTELVENRGVVERLQTLAAQIRSESLTLFYEPDQNNLHNETVHHYSTVLQPLLARLDDDSSQSLVGSQQAIEKLNLLTGQADDWHCRYRQVQQDYLQGGQLSHVRGLLQQLGSSADILLGQQRLSEAVQVRRWRLTASTEARDIAAKILEKRGERWFPLLAEVKAEVDSLARQVEMLASTAQVDHLADIRDNLLKPGLEHLERNLLIMEEEQVLPVGSTSHALEDLKISLFGEGYRIEPKLQTVIADGGFYQLCRDRLQLHQQRMGLEKELQQSYVALENLNAYLLQLTQKRIQTLAQQAEQRVGQVFEQIKIGGGVVLLLFIGLGGLISILVRRQIRQLALLQRHKELILHAAGDGIVGLDGLGRTTFVNPAAAQLLGFEVDELIGENFSEMMPVVREDGDFLSDGEHPVRESLCLTAGEVCRSDLEYFQRRDGSLFSAQYVCTPLIDENGHNEGAVLIFKDITEQQQVKQRLQEKKRLLDHMANHDVLTGLPNRRLFKDRLYHAIERAKRMSSNMSVFFIDLDRFKKINDSLGHEVGDKLLSAVAQRLQQNIRRSDTLARLGGDEFVVVLEDSAATHQAAVQARTLMDELAKVFEIDSHRLFMSASIGISRYPHDAEDATGLMTSADAAMYYAKAHGKNNFQFYTPEMNARAQEFLQLETRLRDAVAQKEFVLLYQPQIDMRDRSLVGVEVLLRWNHPELGVVSPDDFIPLAEETGLIIPIGEWVLQTVCEQNQQWLAQGITPVRVAVNISAVQFYSDLQATVERVLEQTAMSADLLELEITESMLMEDDSRATSLLNSLKEKGIHLSIDDFGTGYSSLSYLKRLPVDKLKIDRSFVCDMTENDNDAAIVTSIIALGGNMNLEVIAEGVELIEQEHLLREHGCYIGQGYFYAKPMKAEEFVEWLC
ncbi:MAG: EAL domain-containing protein [Desulfuromonas sp.]|nr:EAL domain-containing protein [Desulfuromonas sp.]